MSINITMPALSPTMEEGNLAKWLVGEGDAISPGDVIAEIETDKATMEVEAVDEGTLAKILVPAGTENVPVNEVIAVLAEEGEDAADIDTSATSQPAEPSKADADAQRTPEAKTVEAEAARAVDHGKPEISSSMQTSVEPTTAQRTSGGDGGERVFASPLARRIAAQNDLAIENIAGSGPRGRIVKSDVEKALKDGSATSAKPVQDTAASAATKAAPVSGMPDDAVLRLFEEGSYEKKPHDGMRRTIAERLSQSSQTVPSYFISMDCEIDALLALRKQVNDSAPEDGDGKPTYKVSVNDFIVKAMAMALMRVPAANASWTSTDRLYHKHADIGVAVSVEDGLFTPIVRRAEEKTLSVISTEIKDMAGRAKTKKLKPEEYQGGSTAVSNMGMFGVKEFTSIINPPHASILSIGAGEKRAVVKDDALAIATVMTATFAFDHRVIDGALGAELAAAFKALIESPMGMLV